MRSVYLTIFLSLIIGFAFSTTAPAYALPTVQELSTDISEQQLAVAERQLLQKTFDTDPLAKRLQRLELVIFGTTQYGSDEQRWQNIQHYLGNANKTDKKNISSSLNELEKYVFKKTTPAESLSVRLNKLEIKLFGKTSPSMPTAYRIARLKRTLGLETSGETAQIPRFMPGNQITPGMPGFGNNFGFGDMNDPDFSQFDSQMAQLFRQMEQLPQMQPNGGDKSHNGEFNFHYYMYSTPDGGFRFGEEPPPGFNKNPDNNPNSNKGSKNLPKGNRIPDGNKIPEFSAPQITPQPSVPEQHIPSYADPNFI